MQFYLHQWTYKDPQVRAMVIKPQDRQEVVRVATHAFGGKLHNFFFCFGEYDGVSLCEFPDNKTALACMMSIVGQGGVASIKTTPLVTMDDGREAMELANVTAYKPPTDTA